MENTGGNQQVLVGSRLETLGSFSRLPRLITRHFSSWMKVIRRVVLSVVFACEIKPQLNYDSDKPLWFGCSGNLVLL